jgi:uncharacterized protein (DUF1697 family)
MTRYVGLLRGINVGGNKKVPMAELRTTLAGAGLGDVKTLLNSGNAVFTASDAPEALESLLEKVILTELGQSVRCLVRDAAEIRAVIEANPFPDAADDGSRYMAVFTSAPVGDEVVQVDPDNIRVGDRVIYQWCRQGVLEAPDLKAWAAKNLGVVVTGRNWNTVRKIAALLDA